MQTVGEILKTARLKQKLTFTQVEKLTKIPVATLIALEKNQFSHLPASPYIKGFIQNYARALHLNSTHVVAVFKRDYVLKTNKKLLPQGLQQPLNSSYRLKPQTKTILSLVLVFLALAIYLLLTLFNLNQPPSLTLFQPEDGLTTTSPILIKGKTDHDASLTLNGKTINIEPDGSFTTVYMGAPGSHQLKLTATSRRQKSTQVIRHLVITKNP